MKTVTDTPPQEQVIIEDPTLVPGFTQIPNAVLRRPDVSPGAKVTYMVLLSYAWQKDAAYPGQVRLARDCGVTDRSVRRYLQELIEHELVRIVRRGHTKTNVYVIRKISPDNISGLTQGVSTLPDKSSDHELLFLSGHERTIFPTKNTQSEEDPKKEDEERYAPSFEVRQELTLEEKRAMLAAARAEIRAQMGRK